MADGGFGYVAGGTILPRRFVKFGATAGRVVQAVADDATEGVSGSSTRAGNLAGLDDGNHAIAGESVRVARLGEVVDIEAGAAFALGERLMPDANGKAIAATAELPFGAIALAAATADGQFIPCRIERGLIAAEPA